MVITKYSNINEIRGWLDYYGVSYKKNERKASLVKKMEKVREIFEEMGEKEYTNSLLSPEDIRRSQRINELLQMLAIQSGMAGEYLDSVEKEAQETKTMKDVTDSFTTSETPSTESIKEETFTVIEKDDVPVPEVVAENELSNSEAKEDDIDGSLVVEEEKDSSEKVLEKEVSTEEGMGKKALFVVLFAIGVIAALSLAGYLWGASFG
jgi:hypothetical protein